MERTESTVVQVAPNFENAKIEEMQRFYWSLQGRQEMHEKGNAEGSSDAIGGGYTITTTYHHYVKLHFVRSLGLPKLNEIKKIESEYFSVPFPAPAKWSMMSHVYALLFTGGLANAAWLVYYLMKNPKCRTICQQSMQRRHELLAQLDGLIAQIEAESQTSRAAG